MSDIRSFFTSKPQDKQKVKNGTSKNRPKPLISDSSDDEIVEGTPKQNLQSKNRTTKGGKCLIDKKVSKRKLSDSSADEFETISNDNSKRSKSTRNKPTNTLPANQPLPTKNGTHSNEQTKNGNKPLKPVDANDFFKSSTANLKPLLKIKKSPPKQDIKKRKHETINQNTLQEHLDKLNCGNKRVSTSKIELEDKNLKTDSTDIDKITKCL